MRIFDELIQKIQKSSTAHKQGETEIYSGMEVRLMNGQQTQTIPLKQEIMLQINERLYIQGTIPKLSYEQAKTRIVEGRPYGHL